VGDFRCETFATSKPTHADGVDRRQGRRMTKADGKADDASWKIEHVEEQLYDIFTYLPYTATDVKMRRPALTNAHTIGEGEW
jgi:hypothetical protein